MAKMKTQVDTFRESEAARIEAWRLEVAIGLRDRQGAKFTPGAVEQLVARTDVDLRYLERLLDNGCPARVALRIVL